MLYLSDHIDKTRNISWWPFLWILLGTYEVSCFEYIPEVYHCDRFNYGHKICWEIKTFKWCSRQHVNTSRIYHRVDTAVILERDICEAYWDTWISRPNPSKVSPWCDFTISDVYISHKKLTYLWNPCRIVYKVTRRFTFRFWSVWNKILLII